MVNYTNCKIYIQYDWPINEKKSKLIAKNVERKSRKQVKTAIKRSEQLSVLRMLKMAPRNINVSTTYSTSYEPISSLQPLLPQNVLKRISHCTGSNNLNGLRFLLFTLIFCGPSAHPLFYRVCPTKEAWSLCLKTMAWLALYNYHFISDEPIHTGTHPGERREVSQRHWAADPGPEFG